MYNSVVNQEPSSEINLRSQLAFPSSASRTASGGLRTSNHRKRLNTDSGREETTRCRRSPRTKEVEETDDGSNKCFAVNDTGRVLKMLRCNFVGCQPAHGHAAYITRIQSDTATNIALAGADTTTSKQICKINAQNFQEEPQHAESDTPRNREASSQSANCAVPRK